MFSLSNWRAQRATRGDDLHARDGFLFVLDQLEFVVRELAPLGRFCCGCDVFVGIQFLRLLWLPFASSSVLYGVIDSEDKTSCVEDFLESNSGHVFRSD